VSGCRQPTMRTAIFADLHDNYVGLTAVLDDAAAHES
jgi:hypothetical protein